MPYIAPLSLDEAVHNLINLHLFPDCMLRLGQTDQRHLVDANVTWTRTGNPHWAGFDALTLQYKIDGEGFALRLLAIWADQDQATARVRTVDLDGNEEGARAWLDQASTYHRTVPDMLAQIDLH